MLPWAITDEDISGLSEYYPGQEANGLITLKAFYYSGFRVPGLACLALYIFIVCMVLINFLQKVGKLLFPTFYGRQRARLAYLRAYLLNVPLYGHKHSEPYFLFGRSWIPIRAPLRFQTLVIIALFLFNLILLVACYDVTPGDINVYWPGPNSHQIQMARYAADRSCVLAMGQLPLIFITAGRQSILAMLTGMDFNDSMLYHRWLARMVWLQVSVHSFSYTWQGVQDGYLAEEFKEAYWNWGVVATVMFWLLTILAYGKLRTKAYEVFVALHVLFAVLGLVGTYFHIHLLAYNKYHAFIALTEISAAVWAADRVFRAGNRLFNSLRLRKKGMLATATVVSHHADLIRLRMKVPLSRVQLPGDDHQDSSSSAASIASALIPKIAPGHSVRILVPRVQFFSDHPFTVIGTGKIQNDDEDAREQLGYIDLLIREQKGFTKQLAKLGKVSEGVNQETDVETGTLKGKQSAIFVEGPYGHIYYDEIEHADEVLLFAGGVGVAYTLPYMIETALRNPNVPCTLIWMIRDLALFEIVMDQLKETVQALTSDTKAEKYIKRAPLTISLHITSHESAVEGPFASIAELNKARNDTAAKEENHAKRTSSVADGSGDSTSSKREEEESVAEKEPRPGNGPRTPTEGFYDELEPFFRVTTSYGRASREIGHHVSASSSGECQKRRLLVCACGPASLCDDVRYEASRALASRHYEDVCFVEESFNW